MPRFIVMATLDSIEDLAVVVASNHASIAVQTLLPQGVLPLTMAFSSCLLRVRFRAGQLLGAAIILAGVVFVVVPLFQQAPDPSAPGGGTTSTFFAVVIFAANVPGALSSIWKQVSLQRLGARACRLCLNYFHTSHSHPVFNLHAQQKSTYST